MRKIRSKIHMLDQHNQNQRLHKKNIIVAKYKAWKAALIHSDNEEFEAWKAACVEQKSWHKKNDCKARHVKQERENLKRKKEGEES